MKRFLKCSARLLAVLWLAVALAIGLIYIHQTYTIKHIVVTVNSGSATSAAGLEDLYKQNMLLVSEEQIEKDLQYKNPALQSISVVRAFPSTLKISIIHRKPLAALQVSEEGVFIVDKDGIILVRQQKYAGTLPVLKYYQSFQYRQYQVGDRIDYKDLITTLYFVDTLNGFGYPSKRIDIDGLYMIRLLVIGDKMFFLTSDKDREVQMYQLKELLRQFKIQGKDFKTIDLRFDKPVITIK